MTTLPKLQPDSKPVSIIGADTLGSRIALMLSSSRGEVRIFDKNPNQNKWPNALSKRRCRISLSLGKVHELDV